MTKRADATCPICRRKLQAGKLPPTHPFCSPRCKMVDLGNWLGDGYVIAGAAAERVGDLVLDEETLAALLREPS
ncbi:MAG: DNA gyrase inhibitor YacG [Polyangiales bacterium]